MLNIKKSVFYHSTCMIFIYPSHTSLCTKLRAPGAISATWERVVATIYDDIYVTSLGSCIHKFYSTDVLPKRGGARSCMRM